MDGFGASTIVTGCGASVATCVSDIYTFSILSLCLGRASGLCSRPNLLAHFSVLQYLGPSSGSITRHPVRAKSSRWALRPSTHLLEATDLYPAMSDWIIGIAMRLGLSIGRPSSSRQCPSRQIYFM